MDIRSIPVGAYQTNCYVVRGGGFQMVVDPGSQPDMIKDLLEGPVTHIVLTHTHFDHVGAVSNLKSLFPQAELSYGSLEDVSPEKIKDIARRCAVDMDIVLPKADRLLAEGDLVCGFTVLHTPGHTPGGICLYNEKEKTLLSGDTLFLHGFGRTDLGGSRRQLIESLNRLFDLPEDTVVHPGHGGQTTIGSEREYYHVG